MPTSDRSSTSLLAAAVAIAAVAVSVALTVAATAHSQPPALGELLEEEPDGNELVSPSFVLPDPPLKRDDSARPALLGVRLAVEPDWHIYWQNNGASGGPPRFEWTAPEGIAVGEPIWPVPERKLILGDSAVDYVYYGEPVIFFPVTVHESVQGEATELALRVSWLVCDDVCLPGEAALTVTVPISDVRPRPTMISEEVASALDRIPRPTAPAAVSIRRRGSSVVLRVPGAESLEFLPFRHDAVSMADEVNEGAAEGDRLSMRLQGPRELLPSFGGVLVVNRDGDRRGYIVQSLQ